MFERERWSHTVIYICLYGILVMLELMNVKHITVIDWSYVAVLDWVYIF